MTPLQKLNVPVKKAKHVASILVGVIFAKKTMVGSYQNASPNVPKTTSENTIQNMSPTPTTKFHLITHANITI